MQILEGYSKKQKIKLAKYKGTSIEMLDELINDDVEVKVEVYKRKDFCEIKDMLKNLDEQEYKLFKTSIKKGLIDEKLKFIYFKFIFIILAGFIMIIGVNL